MTKPLQQSFIFIQLLAIMLYPSENLHQFSWPQTRFSSACVYLHNVVGPFWNYKRKYVKLLTRICPCKEVAFDLWNTEGTGNRNIPVHRTTNKRRQTSNSKPPLHILSARRGACFLLSLSSTFTKFFFTLLGLYVPPSLAGGGGRLARAERRDSVKIISKFLQ